MIQRGISKSREALTAYWNLFSAEVLANPDPDSFYAISGNAQLLLLLLLLLLFSKRDRKYSGVKLLKERSLSKDSIKVFWNPDTLGYTASFHGNYWRALHNSFQWVPWIVLCIDAICAQGREPASKMAGHQLSSQEEEVAWGSPADTNTAVKSLQVTLQQHDLGFMAIMMGIIISKNNNYWKRKPS